MNAVVVYNPQSGSALSANELRAKCAQHAITVDALIPVGNSLKTSLAPFIAQHATILVVGGDGTLSAVAGLIVGTKAVFVPIPGGTLNHFTKDLGIEQDIDKALANVASAHVRAVDVAAVNDTVFINNSSIGLYPASLQLRSTLEHRIGKWPAAVVSSVRALIRFRVYTVTINNEVFRTPFVFIGNNTYKLNAPGAPTRDALNKATLSVFIAHTTSRWGFVKGVLYAGLGKAHQLDEFEERTGKSFLIRIPKKRISISRDGEVNRMTLPLEYSVRPGKLYVRY